MNNSISVEGMSLKKCLVIGTSNSIVNGGWYDAFKENSDFVVDRVALGGAPFTQFFSKLSTLNLKEYEFVVLECSPNDESYSDKVGFTWFFDTLYHNFLLNIVQETNLVILRVPTMSVLKNTSIVWERQCRIAEDLNVQIYDFTEDLMKAHDGKDDTFSCLYRDLYHPITQVMYDNGVFFANWLKLQNTSSSLSLKVKPTFSIYTQKINSVEKTVINNSLVNEEFNLLSNGESFKFKRPGVCIGYYIDAEHSQGCLKMHGLNDDNRHSLVYYDTEKHKGIMKFVPIPNGFFLKAISITPPYRVIDYALHSNIHLGSENKISFGDFVFLDSN